jgi:hypothetical protein
MSMLEESTQVVNRLMSGVFNNRGSPRKADISCG